MLKKILVLIPVLAIGGALLWYFLAADEPQRAIEQPAANAAASSEPGKQPGLNRASPEADAPPAEPFLLPPLNESSPKPAASDEEEDDEAPDPYAPCEQIEDIDDADRCSEEVDTRIDQLIESCERYDDPDVWDACMEAAQSGEEYRPGRR